MIKPTALAKLFVTVLVVALLGAVFAAPGIAVEGTDDSGGQAAPAEPETQGAPAEPDGTEQPAPDTSGTEEEGTTSGDSSTPTQEEKDRFNRYCTSTDSEPSHNDKKFCDDFKQKYGETGAGASSTGGPTQEEKDRYERYCTSKDSEPSHNDKKFCEDYEKKYPEEAKAENAAANGENAANAENEEAKKEDEPNSGPLAFTGLDVWQLVLLGMVLVGGGLGARKLLAN